MLQFLSVKTWALMEMLDATTNSKNLYKKILELRNIGLFNLKKINLTVENQE